MTADGNHHVFNQFTLRTERRDELREFLSARGVGSGVYYPAPLHLQTCFASLGYGEGDLPTAESLVSEVISLPVSPEMGTEQQDWVMRSIREFYGAA